MTHESSRAAPRIAVVVPIFRHSVLLAEAAQCIFDQEAPFDIHLVLINDGCPHRETDAVCRDLQLAHPDSVTYLRKPNGGLSDARNHGIRHVLNEMPSVEAVYLLDADNKLRPHSLARAMAVLDDNPDVDWVYPNIDMVGMEFAGDYGGDYSRLVHTDMNICEAGSLVHRRVFDAGVFFDTNYQLGFEDWDFFLTAAGAGFQGRNLEDFGFQYRKRPESMLANSARDVAMIRGEMRQKHKKMLSPTSLLQMEHEECPRYAIYLPDTQEVQLVVDPLAANPRTIPLAEFEKLLWDHKIAPTRTHLPPFVVVMRQTMLDILKQANVLQWALWKLEGMADRSAISTLAVEANLDNRFGFSEFPAAEGRQNEASVLVATRKMMLEVLMDNSTAWINTLVIPSAQPSVSAVELRVPESFVDLETAALNATASFDFLTLTNRMHASPYRASAFQAWDWRVGDIRSRPFVNSIVRQPFNGAPAYPRLPDGRQHMGFILPLVEFGGVEKVALNMAAGMKAHGWIPHLFVVGANEGAISEEWCEVFETINFLADDAFNLWGGDQNAYFGTNVPDWATGGAHGTALGLLSWLDAVVNFHGAAINGVMGQLKRFGVKTAISLHLNELSPYGRPLGNTFLGVAYEHAYDLFVPCSHQLGDWCHSMGVPEQKIVPVPNAPSFPADANSLADLHVARSHRAPNANLRVMFLGRLDRQKGLDRLSETFLESARLGLPIDWRIIGKAVVEGEAPPLPEHMMEVLEPPLHTPEELLAAFEWADAMVLLSSFEGLPLTILEAMRSGVVPIATDVGAVSEVLQQDVNGILLDLDTATRDCVQALTELSADRARLRRLSDRAYLDMVDRNWETETEALDQKLHDLIEAARRKAS